MLGTVEQALKVMAVPKAKQREIFHGELPAEHKRMDASALKIEKS
ncbi:hypothetical protein NLX66_018555 [Acinetobacter baumannii]|nr:hypothetical protein [Acinetobacter baumannii]